MIPTLCAASLLPLHLYREETHAESDTASPLFKENCGKKCSPLHQALQRTATANAAARNERGSAMSERLHLYIIYIGAQSNGQTFKIEVQSLTSIEYPSREGNPSSKP